MVLERMTEEWVAPRLHVVSLSKVSLQGQTYAETSSQFGQVRGKHHPICRCCIAPPGRVLFAYINASSKP